MFNRFSSLELDFPTSRHDGHPRVKPIESPGIALTANLGS